MYITQAVQFLPRKGVVVTPLKTEASKRGLPIPETVLASLIRHKQMFPGKEFIFATSNDTPIEPRNLLRHFHGTMRKMGLPKMRFHSLHHTCSSIYLLAGVNPKTVQALLGHSTVMLTMDTYSHLLPSVTEEAVDRVDRLFHDGDDGHQEVDEGPADGECKNW